MRRRTADRRWDGWLWASALLLVIAGGADADDAFFLTGGELHRGDGRVVEGAVIEVRDGRVAAVGGPESVIPDGAVVRDVSGAWITPGLIASATRLGLVEIDLEAKARDGERVEEAVIRASFDPAPAIRVDSSLIPVQAVAGVTSAVVSPTGGLLSGQVAWLDLLHRDLRGAVAGRSIAISGKLARQVGESRAASLGRLRRVLADAAFYAERRDRHERRELRDLAAHPLELEALQPVLNREIPLNLRAQGAGEILSILEVASEFGVRVSIVGGAEAWRVADELVEADVPVILRPSLNLPGDFSQMGARLDNAALLRAAGVEIAIACIGDAHNLRTITQEAGIAVAHGLDWEEALTAVTLAPARIHGMETDYGSVESGKVANLVVWNGDPFELSSWPLHVFIRGMEVSKETRQTQLRDRYRDVITRPH